MSQLRVFWDCGDSGEFMGCEMKNNTMQKISCLTYPYPLVLQQIEVGLTEEKGKRTCELYPRSHIGSFSHLQKMYTLLAVRTKNWVKDDENMDEYHTRESRYSHFDWKYVFWWAKLAY